MSLCVKDFFLEKKNFGLSKESLDVLLIRVRDWVRKEGITVITVETLHALSIHKDAISQEEKGIRIWFTAE